MTNDTPLPFDLPAPTPLRIVKALGITDNQLVAEQPDITLAEIKAVLATEKMTVGQSSIPD